MSKEIIKRAYHILPLDGIQKGEFIVEADKVEDYANSMKEWVRAAENGVAMIVSHRDLSREVGTVRDVELDSEGVWAIVDHTPEEFSLVTEMGWRRVSGQFIKGYEQFKEGAKRVWDMILGHLAFVTSPHFHEQKAPKLVPSGQYSEMACFSLEGEQKPTKELTNLTNQEETMAEKDETPKVPESLEAREEPKEELYKDEKEKMEMEDRLEALEAEVGGLKSALDEAMERLAALEGDEPEGGEDEAEAEEEHDEREEMSARIEVLRETAGLSLGSFDEDSLVELKMKTPKAYEKVIGEFSSRTSEPSRTATGDVAKRASRVAPAKIKERVSEEEALEAALSSDNPAKTWFELTRGQ